MILPIVAYGDAVLRAKTTEIEPTYAKLKELINDMYETMHAASGVGLAAPQVGLSIRMFITDAAPMAEDEDLSPQESATLKNFKKVFINPVIIEESGKEWDYNEGCLSIPDIREEVSRKPQLTITYSDENFQQKTETYTGLAARIIQHEYDHIEGILFTDKLSPFKKRILKGKLANITKGKVQPGYKMRFPNR